MAKTKQLTATQSAAKQDSSANCPKGDENRDNISKVREIIFDFAFGGALVDATSQKAFNPKDEKAKSTARQIITRKAKGLVQKYIQDLLDHKGVDDGAFMAYATAIAESLRGETFGVDLNAERGDESEFTFGNIQKLINMTVKNQYGRYFDDEGKRACFRNCHCPMDSRMIKKVAKEYREKGADDKLKKIKWSSVKWSKLVFKNTQNECSKAYYDTFQRMVRELADAEGLTPIEYDFVHWDCDE